MTVGQIATRHPELIPALDALGIDYRCGRERLLNECIARMGQSLSSVIERLTDYESGGVRSYWLRRVVNDGTGRPHRTSAPSLRMRSARSSSGIGRQMR